MNRQIKMHDVVALLQDTSARHFTTGEDLLLLRGQIGTVVMTYGDGAIEVEFSGRDGRPYAMLTLLAKELMLLRDSLEPAAVRRIAPLESKSYVLLAIRRAR